MSYDIYYDKRFIKVGDKYIPLVQSGNNRTFESNYNGKWIAEKKWYVMNHPFYSKMLFTKEELIELYNGPYYKGDEHYKSNTSCHKDFPAWLIAGIGSAMTIEEHLALNNHLYFSYKADGEYQESKFSSEEEFFSGYAVLEKLKVEYPKISFDARDINKPRKSTKEPASKDWTSFYVLSNNTHGRRSYFLKSGKRRFWNIGLPQEAKRFKTCEAAEKYMLNNPRIPWDGYAPEHVVL